MARVEVNGLGVIDFPDDTPPEIMTAAVHKAFQQKLQADNPAEYDPHSPQFQAKYGTPLPETQPLTEKTTTFGFPDIRLNPAWLKGAGELALSMGTGMVTSPVNHVMAGISEMNDQKPGPGISPYQPKTPEGQSMAGALGAALSPVAQKIENWTGLNDPDAPHRATGHFINALADVMPGIDLAKRVTAGMKARSALVPTMEDIKGQSQAAYNEAEKSGEILPRTKLEDFVPKAEETLAAEGLDKTLHPNTMAALNRLYDEAIEPGKGSPKGDIIRERIAARNAPPEATPEAPKTADEWIANLGRAATKDATPEEMATMGFSPKGAETIRKVLGDAEDKAFAESPPGRPSADYRLASKLKDQFDDFLDENMPATTEAGKEARAKWAQYRRTQDIEDLIDRAKNQAGGFTQSGMENALRTKFRQLADNPRRFGKFSPDEQAAILKVVRNDSLISGLRQLGKLSPAHSGLALMGELFGAAANLPAALTVAGVGTGSRMLAEALRKSRANAVSQLVRMGGNSRDLPGLLENIPNAGPIEQAANAPAYIDANDRARKLAQALGR